MVLVLVAAMYEPKDHVNSLSLSRAPQSARAQVPESPKFALGGQGTPPQSSSRLRCGNHPCCSMDAGVVCDLWQCCRRRASF